VLIALDSSGDPYSPLHAASALYREQKWGDQVCGQKTESSHRLSPGSRIDITDHTKEIRDIRTNPWRLILGYFG